MKSLEDLENEGFSLLLCCGSHRIYVMHDKAGNPIRLARYYEIEGLVEEESINRLVEEGLWY